MNPSYKEGDKLYVITRQDIDPGYQDMQSMHGAIQFSQEHKEIHNVWFKQPNYLLAWLSAKDEGELFEILSKASQLGIKFSIWREPDVENEVTAIALEPGEKTAKLCKGLSFALRELGG